MSEEGLVFVALTFLGMGVGALYGRIDAGTLIGIGLGFLGMALVRMWRSTKGQEQG